MDVSRRQLVAAAAAVTAGAIVGTVDIPPTAAAADSHLAGIHISCLLKGVSAGPFNGLPYSVMFTLWGADDALNGMGWGATVEGARDPVEAYVGASVYPIVFAAQGVVEGELVKLTAIKIFSGGRIGQGLPWRIEASLATGAVRCVEVNAEMGTEIVLEGTGVVARI